jgi:Holliday junction resolvase RusA-like endonuclease
VILEALSRANPIWTITLPMPTANNAMYIPVGGKGKGRNRIVISPAYRLWRDSLNLLEWDASPVVDGRVFVEIEIRAGEGLTDKSDHDGFTKASIDALVRHGVLCDDNRKYVAGSITYFGRPAMNCFHEGYAEVRIYPESVL